MNKSQLKITILDMTTIDNVTKFTVYDWAHFDPNDFDPGTEPGDCAVHEIMAKTPEEAIDIVASICERGPDDELFVSWVFESPNIPTNLFHEVYDYGVKGDVIVLKRPSA